MDRSSLQVFQVRWWRDTNCHLQTVVAMDDGRRADTQPEGCSAAQESARLHPHSSPGSTTVEKSKERMKDEPSSATGPSMASMEAVRLIGTHGQGRTDLRLVPSQYGGQCFPALPRKRCSTPGLNSFIGGSSAPTAPPWGPWGCQAAPRCPRGSQDSLGCRDGLTSRHPCHRLSLYLSQEGPQREPGGGPPNCPRPSLGHQTQRLSS